MCDGCGTFVHLYLIISETARLKGKFEQDMKYVSIFCAVSFQNIFHSNKYIAGYAISR
jgi:hypothetical protein